MKKPDKLVPGDEFVRTFSKADWMFWEQAEPLKPSSVEVGQVWEMPNGQQWLVTEIDNTQRYPVKARTLNEGSGMAYETGFESFGWTHASLLGLNQVRAIRCAGCCAAAGSQHRRRGLHLRGRARVK